METTFHSVSEEWLLKSLVKKEDNVLIERQSREKSVNLPQWKQTDFLKYLLLTGNEIDLKKVLCLHLFAITVPPKACKRSEDNHKIVEFTTYSFALPNFFLHDYDEEEFYCRCWYNENKEKIGKLRPCKIHLAVNVAIVEIIETVIEVLNHSDKLAIEKLITLSHDLSAIKACLSDKQYLDYIADLRNYGIFNNIRELRTEACTIIKATPKLIEVSHIRKNMVLSLRVPDLINSPNDWFLTNATDKTVFNSLKSKIKKKDPISNENKEVENNKDITIQPNRNKICKKVPYYNSVTIKRWPFTEKEINIKKELEQVKRISDKYLRKYNLNSNDNIETKNICELSGSSSHRNEITKNETKQIKSPDSIKINSKLKISALSKSAEKKYKNASFHSQNERDPSSEQLLLNNKSAQSREKCWVKNFSKLREKEANKGDVTDITNSDNNKLVFQGIDKTDLKTGLMKLELRSKIWKLISSIDDSC